MANVEPIGETQVEARGQLASGVLLATSGTFLFALKSILIKLAYVEGVGPTLILTLRMLFSLPFYVFIFAYLQRSETYVKIPRKIVAKALLLGFLGYYLASFLDLFGLVYISAQLERLTLFSYPAMVAVLAWMFLGEKLNRRIILSIVLCYAGVCLMYGQESSGENSNVNLGVILVMGAALSYSLYILFAKPTMQVIGSRRFTSLAMIGSTVFVVIHAAFVLPVSDFLGAPLLVYGYCLILAVVCTVFPSFMINEAIVRIGATKTTVIGSIGPVLTMMLAIAILGEPSSIFHFLGMGVAIVGVSLVARK